MFILGTRENIKDRTEPVLVSYELLKTELVKILKTELQCKA
jgi:hypothetical protein